MATLTAATVAINLVAGTEGFTRGMQAATRSAEGWEKSLLSQVRAMQMGEDEARLYQLALRGADSATRDRIRSLLNEKKAIEDAAIAERQAAEALQAEQKRATEALVAAQDRQSQAMMRGMQVFQATRTPIESHRDRVSELNGLLRVGAINQDTYNRALLQSQQQASAGQNAIESLAGRYSRFGDILGPAGIAVGVFAAELATLGAAAYVAVAGVASLTIKGLETINALVDEASSIGVTTDALVKLQHAADLNGSSAEKMNTALRKMGQTLGDAVRNGGPAAKALEDLGLSSEKLANESPDKAFRDIAEALGNVHNQSLRASIMVDIFGKSARDINGVINAGVGGLDDAAAQAERFGIAVSEVDAKKVDAAMDAFGNLGKILLGVGETIAIEIAPGIQAAAEMIADFATSGGGIKTEVGGALESVGNILLGMVDAAQVVFDAFELLFGNAIDGASVLIDKLGGIKGTLAFIAGLAPGVGSLVALGELGAGTSDSGRLSSKLKDEWAALQARAQAIASAAAANDALSENANAVNEALQKAAQSAEQLIAGIEKEANTVGLSKRAAALEELSRMGQLTTENVDRVNAAFDKLDAASAAKNQADAFKKLEEDANKLFEDTRTPAEKYEEQLRRIGDMVDAGVIDWDTYARAVEKANDAFQKASEVKTVKAPQLGDTPQFGAEEVRFRASIRGLDSPDQNEAAKDAADTAENTEVTAEATGELRDLFRERFNFDVADIQV